MIGEERWGRSAIGYVCISFYISNLFGVVIFAGIYAGLEEGVAVSLSWIYSTFLYKCILFGVVV